MTVLSEQIGSRTKGPMGEKEDWWRLCYDTNSKEFYVEHDWSHTSLNALKTDSGTERHDPDKWTGTGSEKIEGAKARLLARAKA
ncbi:MAG: hypothetical protein Q7J32_12095 [Sphingomonadaceae bacterium]|nr:hypothetical protein [Sphingomonadaceae bacterium]